MWYHAQASALTPPVLMVPVQCQWYGGHFLAYTIDFRSARNQSHQFGPITRKTFSGHTERGDAGRRKSYRNIGAHAAVSLVPAQCQ